ncbi:hypothetical protein RRG08_049783 [Elysia crispata]|uniref:Uncharacterized protein n=1 Tax=Elysia crispata TaxID=231223 RepID=A0AAE0YUP6_9GAST|nr:hypothetical protein RRG08_049783 [Elysia crispata]
MCAPDLWRTSLPFQCCALQIDREPVCVTWIMRSRLMENQFNVRSRLMENLFDVGSRFLENQFAFPVLCAQD